MHFYMNQRLTRLTVELGGTGPTSVNIANDTRLVVPPGHPDAFGSSLRFLWEHSERSEQGAAMGQVAGSR